MASQIDKALLKILKKGAKQVISRIPESKIDRVVISGAGAFLAEKLASQIVSPERVVNLEKTWDSIRASSACAVALVKLAQGRLRS